jgi:hypothetical protein
VPLLKDLPFVDTLEVSGAYRTSDYSTVGKVDTRSFQGLYRPNKTFLFRATYGEATRIPNLGENFSPAGQTFLNNFTDPCDANAIRAIDNVQDRANRRANCTAVLGAGYDPGTDAPNTGTRIIYTAGIPAAAGATPSWCRRTREATPWASPSPRASRAACRSPPTTTTSRSPTSSPRSAPAPRR